MENASARQVWGGRAVAIVGVLLAIGVAILAVAPLLKTQGTYGVHDWDQMFSHRYLAVKTIKRYGQFPFWDPYTCGGHTWWGGLESGTNLVSPWLVPYLLLSLPSAMRVEVVGTAILGAVGCWAFAGRYSKSPGLRLLVTSAFAVNGRWALQTSVGHTWHMYYAWVPWVLFFLDRAIGADGRGSKDSFRDVVLLGATLAMMVYSGAIYPLPQTVVIVGLYSLVCALRMKSARPIGIAAAGGLLSFALAAPKLLPVLDMLRRFPRLIESTETMDLGGFVGVFTVKEGQPHPMVGPWGWHEFGIYTGWIPFIAMIGGLLLSRSTRERALAWAGGACLLLSFGRFHEYAPWALFHDHLPIFKSQHVPSRWQHPAVLVLMAVTISAIDRRLPRRRRWLFEIPLLALGLYVAQDIGIEAQKPMVGALTRPPPSVTESIGPFHTENVAPANLRYNDDDWAPPTLPAMMANVGLVDCSAFPGLNVYLKDSSGRVPGMGAHGKGSPEYRGEVYMASGVGYAAIESFTPNRIIVHYDGATPGDRLIVNQNWDPGWSSSAGPIIDSDHLTSVALTQPSGEVVFRYRPRFFVAGVAILVLTLVGLVLLRRTSRRKKGFPAGSAVPLQSLA
ncbi:hypothetical protein BH09MYX1_BH09MYX1_31320 [soil metagenome]